MTGGIEIRGVILAAGSGERARPLTEWLPKALINVAGKPLIEWIIEGFYLAGVRKITVALGFKAPMIENYLQTLNEKKINDLDIKTVVVPDYHIGPLRTALTAIESFSDEEFIISPVDSIFNPSTITNMIIKHTQLPGEMIMAVDLSSTSGTLVTINRQGLVVGFNENTSNSHVVTGRSAMLLIANRSIIRYCQAVLFEGENRLVDVLSKMICSGIRLHANSVESEWFDIDTLSDVIKANNHLLNHLQSENINNCIFIPSGDMVEIGDGLSIQDYDIAVNKKVLLNGPVLLSSSCRIGENCKIGPNVTLGSFVNIPEGCELINTIMHPNSVIPPNSRLENVIIFGSKIFQVEM